MSQPATGAIGVVLACNRFVQTQILQNGKSSFILRCNAAGYASGPPFDTQKLCYTRRMRILPAGCLLIAACAGTPGAKPHDMSTTGHETAAANEDNAAKEHAAQFDPDASVSKERCPGLTARVAPEAAGACWTSVINPTAQHLDEASKHRKMAADHRAASQALRDAEAKACTGVADADRDMSPFAHREEIASVAVLGTGAKPQGAIVTFRSVPAMTAQWLQRVVDCHIARNAAMGHQSPEMPYCPLVPKNVTATVSAVSDGLAVQIRSDDPAAAQDVWKRAQALKAK